MQLKRFIKEENGAGVVEMILILVVLIGLIILFKDQITDFVEEIFDGVFDQAEKLW